MGHSIRLLIGLLGLMKVLSGIKRLQIRERRKFDLVGLRRTSNIQVDTVI